MTPWPAIATGALSSIGGGTGGVASLGGDTGVESPNSGSGVTGPTATAADAGGAARRVGRRVDAAGAMAGGALSRARLASEGFE